MNYHDRTFGDSFYRRWVGSRSCDLDDEEIHFFLNDMMQRDMDADIDEGD